MYKLIDFLDVHNGSLMVIITLVYVLATIFICYFNGKSAKATQDQIKESRRQYEETKRLEMMPVIQFRRSTNSSHSSEGYCSMVVTPANKSSSGWKFSCEIIFSMKNIGLGNMKEATYSWTNEDGQKINCGTFPIESLCAKEETELTIYFESYEREKMKYGEKTKCLLDLTYKDLLENEYAQAITFVFVNQNPEECFNCSPLLFKECFASKATRISTGEK